MAYFDRSIPKSLDDCMKEDSTVTNLHLWADRLERWGKNLFWILIIIGIVTVVTQIIGYDDIDEDIIVFTVLSTALSWGLYAFIEYCVYNAIALLIRSLAMITHSTLVSANIAIYESGKNLVQTEPTKPVAKSAPRTNVSGLSGSGQAGTKKCPSCGALQSAKRQSCSECGEILY